MKRELIADLREASATIKAAVKLGSFDEEFLDLAKRLRVHADRLESGEQIELLPQSPFGDENVTYRERDRRTS